MNQDEANKAAAFFLKWTANLLIWATISLGIAAIWGADARWMWSSGILAIIFLVLALAKQP